jgi:hypothetical protein
LKTGYWLFLGSDVKPKWERQKDLVCLARFHNSQRTRASFSITNNQFSIFNPTESSGRGHGNLVTTASSAWRDLGFPKTVERTDALRARTARAPVAGLKIDY